MPAAARSAQTLGLTQERLGTSQQASANRHIAALMEPFAFVDLLEPGEPIKVHARVHLLSTKDGGRSDPLPKGYRPNHNFGGAQENKFYIGQIQVPELPPFNPGQTRDLTVTFLNGPGLNELLHEGKTWRI